MAEVKYTPEQKKAIDTRDSALLLSAAAGSGKTAVLVQRILGIISDETNDINIDNLLIVTFTNPAAAQMRERIQKELVKLTKQHPENRKLRKQIMLLSGAHIKTIHSFCLDTIKANISGVDIPVNYRVIDTTESSSLMNRAINELIEEKYAANDEDFCSLMDTYGYGATEDTLISIVFSIYKTVKSMANGYGFLDFCLKNIEEAGADFSKSIYSEILIAYCREIVEDHVRKYTFLEEITKDSEDKKIQKLHDFIAIEKSFLFNLSKKETVDSFLGALDELTFPSKPPASGEINDIILAVRSQCKDDIAKVRKIIFCGEEEECRNQRQIYKYIRILVDFIKEFDERFTELKRKKGGIDFSDFEQLAYKLLRDEDGSLKSAALTYRKKFHEVLIDEYQDTSDIQHAIFEAVSRDGLNLFAVGDVKQSIYKFRQARPEHFSKKEEEYENDGKNRMLIRLAHNFRSRREIIDCVNKIFLPIMNKNTGLTDYEKQMLVCGGEFMYNENADYKTEILFFESPRGAQVPEEYRDFKGEALMIVQRIKQLMADPNYLIYDNEKGIFRPLKYEDIVILVRSNGSTAKSIYECMCEYGIPVSAVFSDDFFSQTEIRLIMSILKCIDNPRDDINIISVMKSPAFRFTEDELLKLRLTDRNVPFYDVLLKSEQKRVKEFLAVLDDFIKKSFHLDIAELVSTIYETLKLPERMCAYKNPEQRISNLDAFYDMALDYDNTGSGTLKSFIFYLSDISVSEKKVDDIAQSATSDMVRIMTMHKSKGLEFPVVFVSGLGEEKNKKDIQGTLLINSQYGIGADFIDPKRAAAFNTLSRSAVKCKIKEERVGEEMRLLYVALTRAKDKLILTSTVSNYENKLPEWETVNITGGFTKNTLLSTDKYINWIMPTAINSNLFNIKAFGYQDINLRISASSVHKEGVDYESCEEVFKDDYNYEKTTLPIKVTVSQVNKLSRDTQIEKFYISLDDLDSIQDSFSAAEYGTYFHKMFELVDHNEIKSGKKAKDIIEGLIKNGIIEEYDFTRKAIEGIERFYETQVGKELLYADEVFKEKPFLVRIPAKDIYDTQTDATILLQGTSDCYFVKNNEITLIDFKTNRTPDEEAIRKEYTKQLQLYGYAIGKVTELKVVKKVIYTSENGGVIEIK